MNYFDLPPSTQVNRVVPKNAFDTYTTTKQKKLFTDLIQRISWTHKLSQATLNLPAKEIVEIQVFKIELKEKALIPKVLEIIDKAIPYTLVFWIQKENQAYISTSSKHPHPTQEDLSVIDWTFSSDWFPTDEVPYLFTLKESLDAIFKDLCVQLSGRTELSTKPLQEILQNEQKRYNLEKEIQKLKSKISKCKQFNIKVELNLQLRSMEAELGKLKSGK